MMRPHSVPTSTLRSAASWPCAIRSRSRGHAVASWQRAAAVGSSQPAEGGAVAAAAPPPPPPSYYGVSDRSFFDRRKELQLFSTHLSRSPRGITVVTGPASCGSTAVRRQLVAQLEADGRKVSVIDARTCHVSTPDAMASALGSWQPWLLQDDVGDLVKALVEKAPDHGPGVWAAGVAHKLFIGKQSGKDRVAAAASFGLQDVVYLYLAALSALSVSGGSDKKPVIILDQANVLQEWGPEHKGALSQLLRFFKVMTMQDNSAHVLLFTNDAAFGDWLSKSEQRRGGHPGLGTAP